MYHIAIVEDEEIFANQLQEYLVQYQEEHAQEFRISVFRDGAEILENYTTCYDIILLDIEMPRVNGMDAAERIRAMDENVVLMFITNMATYAIRGYEVGALDFVMKPLSYYTFSVKMTRALKRACQRAPKEIVLTLTDGMKKLDVQDIYYVEIQNRMLHYYTTQGEFILRGTMQSAEKELEAYSFVKCNHWYIVNLMHVKEVKGNLVQVGDASLEISRRNKTAFMKALTMYLGGNA